MSVVGIYSLEGMVGELVVIGGCCSGMTIRKVVVFKGESHAINVTLSTRRVIEISSRTLCPSPLWIFEGGKDFLETAGRKDEGLSHKEQVLVSRRRECLSNLVGKRKRLQLKMNGNSRRKTFPGAKGLTREEGLALEYLWEFRGSRVWYTNGQITRLSLSDRIFPSFIL